MRLKNSIALGLFLALVCPACKQNRNVQQGAGNDYPLLTLTREDRKLSVKYSAVIEGKQDVEIRPQVSGFITDVRVKEGAYCKQRRHSLCHRPGSLSGCVTESRSQRCIGRSQPGHRTADIGRKQLLHDEKVVSDFELRTAENNYRTACASLLQAQAEKRDAENNLSYTEVRSPVNGYAGMTNFRVGALVSSSMSDPLIRVSDNSQMYVYFSMSEKQILS